MIRSGYEGLLTDSHNPPKAKYEKHKVGPLYNRHHWDLSITDTIGTSL